MLKKQMISLVTCSLLGWNTYANAADMDAEFEKFKQASRSEFQAFQQQNEREFAQFVKQWKDAELSFKNEISQHWPDAKLPDQQHWIEYSDDRLQRLIIDYENNQIELELLNHQLSDQQGIELMRQRIEQLSKKTVYEAAKNDPIHINAGVSFEQHSFNAMQTLLSRNEAAESKKAQPQIQRVGKKTSITIKLPAGATHKRAQEFVEPAARHASEYGLPTELVLAVIHTESSFNPMARSHIPAFGLMQIVPQSAGKDITEYLTGRAYLLTPQQLYNSENNIKAGSVYLHLLNSRYFKKVTNDHNRLLMSIAAYNTGPGNVSRALTGTTSLDAAARKANSMTPEQVYQRLLQHLPYAETKNYLKKVTERQHSYAKYMESQ